MLGLTIKKNGIGLFSAAARRVLWSMIYPPRVLIVWSAFLVVLLASLCPFLQFHTIVLFSREEDYGWCTPEKCVDYSRCRNGFHVYEYSEAEVVEALGSYAVHLPVEALQPYLTRDPNQACLFVVHIPNPVVVMEIQLIRRLSRLPHWNGGRNHLVIHLSDQPLTRKWRAAFLGQAMLGVSNAHPSVHIPHFDISLPLGVFNDSARAERNSGRLTHTTPPAPDRKYSLTFKGKVYTRKDGRYRWNVPSIHDPENRIVLLGRCNTYDFGKYDLRYRDECLHLEETYGSHDFIDLMNTTFALIPGGRSPATYRLAEAMAVGAIPVFYTTPYVKPFDDYVAWSEISLAFAPRDIQQITSVLSSLSSSTILEMQRRGEEVYERFIAQWDVTMVAVLKARMLGVPLMSIDPSFHIREEAFSTK